LAVKLYLDDEGTIGGLNLYSTTSEEIDPEAESIAELFAAHAAIALGNACTQETLNDGLQTRKVIGQAIGILMERYEMTEDRAFAFLVRASSTSNIKLREVAQGLVDQKNSGE
jgi:AmiR/NasT family two-component response regulator